MAARGIISYPENRLVVEWNEYENEVSIERYLDRNDTVRLEVSYEDARQIFDALHFLFHLSRYPEVR